MSQKPQNASVEVQTARDDALAILDDVVEEARYKSLGDGRIRTPERERIRARFLRVIISAQAERRKLLADKDLDELAEEVEQLKEEYGHDQAKHQERH